MFKVALIALAAGVVASLVGTGPVRAQALTPNPTTFTMEGRFSTGAGSVGVWDCDYSMTINVDPGGTTGTVTAATFISSPWAPCGLEFIGLPWTISVGPTTNFYIEGIDVQNVYTYYTCGPAYLRVNWDNFGSPWVANFGGTMGSCFAFGAGRVTSGGPIRIE